jgi:hypothetical protein
MVAVLILAIANGVVIAIAVGALRSFWSTRYHLPSPRFSFLSIAVSSVLLLGLLIPWTTWSFGILPPHQRDAIAQGKFGETYQYAKQVLSACSAFQQHTGTLKQLVITGWQNQVKQQAFDQLGYYDFEYVGTRDQGKVAIAVMYRPVSWSKDGKSPAPFKGGINYNRTITLQLRSQQQPESLQDLKCF